uniref:Putative secreted protein n=1 Tax=Anopheles darlingi TaxID=43151 RepID=A0A2M4DN71_ANODA
MVSFSLATVEATALLLLLLGGKSKALFLVRSLGVVSFRRAGIQVGGFPVRVGAALEAQWPWSVAMMVLVA